MKKQKRVPRDFSRITSKKSEKTEKTKSLYFSIIQIFPVLNHFDLQDDLPFSTRKRLKHHLNLKQLYISHSNKTTVKPASDRPLTEATGSVLG